MLLNKKILLSLGTLVFVAAAIAGATGAFFSDTETSTGNTFTAGAIDLTIDNTSYVTNANGVLVSSPNTSWGLSDLTNQLFFNFNDLKPGDIGEDTISLHVSNNNAWLCAAARVTKDVDNTYTEPELADDVSTTTDPTTAPGELGSNLMFAFWADDGDNVLETDEEDSIFVDGTVAQLGQQGKVALVDTDTNQWGTPGTPLDPNQTLYIGKAWCFGDLVAEPEDEDVEGGPLDRGTGFTCNGASDANNAAQTDQVVGDLEFYAVQSRNNSEFTCEDHYTPSWGQS